MYRPIIQLAGCVLAMTMVSLNTVSAQIAPSNIGPAAQGNEKSTETVLTQGPVHEAFAEPIGLNPRVDILAPKEPPPAINEIPPAERPEGGAVWLPGYWSWDDDRQDFIWVSGVWRIPPQGRQWMEGHWERVDGQFRR